MVLLEYVLSCIVAETPSAVQGAGLATRSILQCVLSACPGTLMHPTPTEKACRCSQGCCQTKQLATQTTGHLLCIPEGFTCQHLHNVAHLCHLLFPAEDLRRPHRNLPVLRDPGRPAHHAHMPGCLSTPQHSRSAACRLVQRGCAGALRGLLPVQAAASPRSFEQGEAGGRSGVNRPSQL